jgi:ribosomal protein S18 acetylase RimI-like enzyme
VPSQVQIRRLARIDIGEMQKLRREALELYPLAFSASAQDDLALDTAFIERSLQSSTTSAIFGAVENDQWVGMVGVYRHEGRKENHRAQLWGMYVTPELRRRGIGLSLLSAAIEHVGAWPGVFQIQLCVTEAASDARSLYESAGFRVWGCEPRALQWEGEFADEYHLVLSLKPAAGV